MLRLHRVLRAAFLLTMASCFNDPEYVGGDPQPGTSGTDASDTTTAGSTAGGPDEGTTSTTQTSTTNPSSTSDGDTTEGGGSASSTEASSTTGEEPICDHLELIGDVSDFSVETHPIVANGAMKFTFTSFGGTDVGIRITDPSGTVVVQQETVCAPGGAFPEIEHQAVHCGVEDPGSYCAILVSSAGDHAALPIEVVDGGAAAPCDTALSNCTEIQDWDGSACTCLSG